MAKRVNKRILVVLTALVLGGGVMAMAGMYVLPRLMKKDPVKLIAESKQLEEQGEVDEAIARFKEAVGVDQKNVERLVALGDLYYRHVAHDPQNLGYARQLWEVALGVDPGHKPALQRLLDMHWEYMGKISPQPSSFNAVREAAARVLAADPGNAGATARLNMVTIRQAYANVPTKPGDIDKAVAALRGLAKADPANPDLPFWATQGELYLAAQLARNPADAAEARAKVDAIEPAVAAMLEGQDTNAVMQWRAAQLYTALAPLDSGLRRAPATRPAAAAAGRAAAPATTRPAEGPAGRFTGRVATALGLARQHVKPDNEHYADLQFTVSDWLRVTGKPDEARKLMEEVVQARGDDPAVRLAYSRVFRGDPARRPALMELLAKPVPLTGVTGVEALRRKDMEARLQLELGTYRLASLDAERDPAKRTEVLDRVQADVKRLETAIGAQSVPLMELKGRLLMLQGKMAEGVAVLQTAVDRGRGSSMDYDNTVYVLATAYGQLGQTGQAEKLLRQLVERSPGAVPARVQWIDVLFRDGRPDEARAQLAELKRIAPKAPEIPALEATIEGGKAREAFVEQMPENTPAERVRKAVLLRGEGKNEEALALAEAAYKEDPKFLPAIEQMLELYVALGRRDEAVALAKEAGAANPDNQALKQVPDLLAQRTPQEYEQWRLEQIKAEPDAFQRELKLHEFHLQQAGVAAQRKDEAARKAAVAEADARLAAAEALKPDDIKLTGRRFEFLLQQKRLDEAGGPVLQKLIAANSDGFGGELLRFRLSMAKSDLGAAEAAARDMVRQRPQFALGYQYTGLLHQVQGRYREAIKSYASALERQGRNYDALKGLVDCHYAEEDHATAKTFIDRGRQAFPTDVNFRELAIKHELEHGDPARAVAERERMLKEQPQNANVTLAAADTYLRVLTTQTDPAKLKAWVEKTRKLLEDGMKKWPADVRFQRPLAQVLLATGDFLGGEKILKEYAAHPEVTDKVGADLQLADYYARAQKPAMAEESLREALKKSGDAPGVAAGVRQQLATLAAQTGRMDEAVKHLEGLPGAAVARQRVQYLLAANKRAEAQTAVAEAVAAHPESVELSNLQLDIAVAAGQFAEAERLVQQRLAKNDADGAARYYSALVKLRRQPGADPAAALKELTALSNDYPRAVNVLALLAEAHYVTNDVGAAIEDLNRALVVEPANRDVRLKLIEWSGGAARWDLVTKLATDALAQPRLAGDPAWSRALAVAAAATGKFPEAEKHILKAVSMVRPEAAADLEREHLNILNQAKNYAKIVKTTDAMLAKGRKDWWVHQFRGVAKAGLKDKTAATEFDAALAAVDPEKQFGAASTIVRTVAASMGPAEALKRLEKLEPSNPRWRLVAAEICLGNRDAAGALARLEPLAAGADKLAPDVRASYYRTLAASYHSLSPRPDTAKAADAYTKYIELVQGDVMALNNLAYLLAEEVSPPRPQDAKVYSQKAYAIASGWTPGDQKARVLDTHGWVLVLNDGTDLDAGIKILEDVVSETRLLEAHYHLGEAHLRKKRGADAEEQLTRAAEMIEAAKAKKTPYDDTLEPRIQRALDRAKALNAAAGAR